MEKAPVNFKQERDFGEIFNATFAFIGQEFKSLGRAIFTFVLPILIIAAILMVFIQMEQQKYTNALISDPSNSFGYMGSSLVYSLLLLLVVMVALSTLRCTVYGYIKVYVEKGKDQFTMNDVWIEIRMFFFPILGTAIVIGVLVGLGFVFCIIPGIYLGVTFCVIYMALIFEDKGLGDAFSRSFSLTGQNWWLTFGILVISYILIYLLYVLLSVPAIILGFKSFFTAFKNITNPQPIIFSTGYYIWNSITMLIMYILMSVPFIAIAFQYFSLLEKKERPSLHDKIDQIA